MKTAMILAAGRGKRLKPLTNCLPKVMCKIKGSPLIEHHVVSLAKCGFTRVVINHAYLGGLIRRHLGNGNKWDIEICYSPEPPGALETGGGIFNALPLLGKDPFLVINGDIYTSFAFNTVHLPSRSLAHIILGPNPDHNRKGDFGLKNNHYLQNEEKRYTFLGIACYHPDAFLTSTFGRYSVTPLLRVLAEQRQASGEIFNQLWIDIGSLERLHHATLTI